ncbi:tetratricopeptide repeat protein [Capnocytophaga canimorsus]|uniref:Sel1 repeat family protein n=1 Tax=Capnocytophaga canimorsus (strain 5) TaxID=860228 RepID=F9YPU7_CAPCC|nr:tetratricopeptide repeat protein [Capnocytophaga canimorsus]AEK22192.1 Hypothetical protein Ccan_00700 [Capnocytophaga canimorsus Cc5]VEJ19602.1 Sel1 repeat [Capnocytophaga canimorsus]
MPYTQSNQPQTPNEGNSEALFSLGKYHYEKYVLSYGAEDFYTAKKYLQILAEQNNDDAQFLLGMLYKTKEGAHSKEAIHWFLQAEQNGVKDATDELNQFHYIKEKAEKGCPESLFQLGEYYEFQGFYADAVELWEKAAHYGHTTAQSRIYTYYKNNDNYTKTLYWEKILAEEERNKHIDIGISHFRERKYDKAICFFEKVIEKQDFTISNQYYLSQKEKLKYEAIYYLEKIAEKEKNESVISCLIEHYNGDISWMQGNENYIFWLEKLAKKGNREAYYYLGELFNKQGNMDSAIYWFRKWIGIEGADIHCELEKSYHKQENKESVLSIMDRLPEIKDSDELLYFGKWAYQKEYWEQALYWFGKLAETDSEKVIDTQEMCKWKKGTLFTPTLEWEEQWNKKEYIRAIDIVEEIYYFRIDYDSDVTLLDSDVYYEWEEKLAELGNKDAQCSIAQGYDHWDEDYEKAIEWYEKSAKQGKYQAQFRLGELLYELREDHNQAIYWLYQAQLHKRYEDELVLKVNPKSFKNLTQKSWDMVRHWYSTVAEKGDYLAQLHLGICYNEGLGTEKNTEKALFWLKKSLEHQCIETFRYLEKTKILDFENLYYEQIRKVEEAQPLKREFIQEWLAVNEELFYPLNNPDFEKQFRIKEIFPNFENEFQTEEMRPIIQQNHVIYIFYLMFRDFKTLTKHSPQKYGNLLNEYRSIVENKKKIWVFSPYYKKNVKIPENPTELFKWLLKTKEFGVHVMWNFEFYIADAYQKYNKKALKLYKPDFKQLLQFNKIHPMYWDIDEFHLYQEYGEDILNFI